MIKPRSEEEIELMRENGILVSAAQHAFVCFESYTNHYFSPSDRYRIRPDYLYPAE